MPSEPAPAAATSVSAPSPWRRVLRPLFAVLRVAFAPAVFALALYALNRVAGELHWADVVDEMRDISRGELAAAILLTAGSYLVLTFYDLLALRHAGRRLQYRRTAATSFIAYGLGHSLGAVALSAGAIRYRLYAVAGLTAAENAEVATFCAVTFYLGAGTMLGVSLLAEAGPAAAFLHASPAFAVVLGGLVLALVAAYGVLTVRRRAPLRIWRWSLQLPDWRTTLLQILLSSADLVLAGAALYALLPEDAEVSFLAFSGLYMIAIVVGSISQVPGGLGVFESVLLALLPGMAAEELLGVLVAYRLVYYVLPFLFALVGLAMHEAWVHRQRLRVAWGWVRRSLNVIVPQTMAALASVAGLILLISGATPGIVTRIGRLERLVGLSVLEISHLAGSAIGVGLLILARGLYYRLDAAWQITVWLLGAGMAVSLLKGLDWEEALALGFVLVPLLLTRREFYRRASLSSDPLSVEWLGGVVIAVIASIWVGFVAHQEVPYQHELWWQFAFDASAPRMLRASLVAVLTLGIVAALWLMQPRRRPAPRPTPEDMARVEGIVAASDSVSAPLALLGDKSFLFSGSGRGFVMYGVEARSWIAMGDPVAPPEEKADLVWAFRDLCDREGGRCAFYEVSGDNLPLYVDADLLLTKLGEEARVRVADFSLDGRPRAPLRQAHRKAEREGAGFRMVPAAEVPALLPRLREISDEWLVAKSAVEKGFSLGFFDESYLRHTPCAVVERDGAIVAFANLWHAANGRECSIDLMRYSGAAPKGVMDYLFVELILWSRTQGYDWFSLGMAPLAGLEVHRLAPAWHKLGRLLYRYGENFYNFEGLRHYKNKFLPEWRPRYLATSSAVVLPRVLLDVTRLISGGLGESVLRAGRPAAARDDTPPELRPQAS